LKQMPPFPAVAVKALELLGTDDYLLREVEKVIGADAVFSAELLHCANSPLFGFAQRVSSLRHAIVIVGRERLRSMVLTAALRSFRTSVTDWESFQAWWRHSLASALLCDGLVQAESLYCPQAYAAGLLHDIGRLALLLNVGLRDYRSFLRDATVMGSDILDVERHHFGTDHCVVGGDVLREWKFPADLVFAAEQHHQEATDWGEEWLPYVRAACLIAAALGFGAIPGQPVEALETVSARLTPRAQAAFRLSPEELRGALESRMRSVMGRSTTPAYSKASSSAQLTDTPSGLPATRTPTTSSALGSFQSKPESE
jgi:HD-like signal output (HDOD) protein